MKALLAIIALSALLFGCQHTPSTGDNWPYHGPPMIGTNTIPAPRY